MKKLCLHAAHLYLQPIGSIGLLPASLRHMAVKHFLNCETSPHETRKRMKELCSLKESGLDKAALKKFCTALCTNIGVANRQPHRSGLIVQQLNIFVDDCGQISTPCHPIVPISLFHPLNGCMNPNPLCDKSSWSPPRNEKVNIKHVNASFAPDYVQDVHGLWRCRENRPDLVYADCSKQITLGTTTTGICTSNSNKKAQPSTQNDGLMCTSLPTKVNEEKYHSDKVGVSKVKTSNDSSQLVIDHEKLALTTDLIRPGDKEMISAYAFFAICQFKSCEFSQTIDAKRRGKITRPIFKEKFAGFQCIHCVNGNQPRKFFFSKVERLCNNFSEMTSHVFKCKHCPPDVKSKLKTLKNSRLDQHNKVRRGSQKLFFNKLWVRLQGEQSMSKVPEQSVSQVPNQIESTLKKQSVSTAPKQGLSTEPMKSVPVSKKQIIPEKKNSLGSFQARCLAEPDDKEWFDEAECLARKGVQIFCATNFDVSFWKASIRKLNINVGQVGLRCLYCTRTERNAVDLDATIFPSKIEDLRDDVQLLYHRHSLKCKSAPHHIKLLLETVKATGSNSSKELNDRYIDWAKQFGLYNEKDGVVLYKQGAQKLDRQGDLPTLLPLLEPTIDQQSFQIEDILPKPPLEALCDDVRALNPPNPSAISVTPCVLGGLKRRHAETIQDAETIQPNAKKHCAV